MSESVWLNSNEYKITGKVLKTALPSWPETVRLTTEEQRESLAGAGKWVIKFDGGFGRYTVPIGDPYNKEGDFYDSELETRWAEENYATLPAAINSPTADGSGTYTDVYFLDQCDFNGELYALVQQYKAGPAYIVSIFQWTGSTTTWARVADLGIESTVVSTGSRGYLKAVGNTLYAHVLNAVTGPVTGINLYSSTDGTTWSAAKAQTGRVAYGASDQAGPMLQWGTQLILTYWDNSAGLIYCYYSTDGGANVVQITSFASSGIPIGLTLWRDESGNAVPWLRTKENAGYLSDTDANNNLDAYISVLDTPGTQSNDYGLAVWEGHLYCPIADGLYRCWYDNGVFTTQAVGLNKRSLLTALRQGTTTAMISSSQWLFVAYGSTVATHDSYIYAWDGEKWRHVSIGTGTDIKLIKNIVVSYNDDAINRLHLVQESTATATAERFLNYILDSPSGNWTYNPGGANGMTFLTPYFDAGMGEITGVLLRIDLIVDSLDTTAAADKRYVKLKYQADFGSLTTLGSFVSGTKTLSFGTNAKGVSFKNVRFEFEAYAHSDGSNSPNIYYAVLYFKKKPARRWRWQFTVDLTQQPRWSGERVDSVTQLSNLETDIDTVTLLPFRYGDMQTDKYVEIVDPLLEETEWVESGGRILPQHREGRVAVTVETPL